MRVKNALIISILLVLLSGLAPFLTVESAIAATLKTGALVLVNSTSTNYGDFQHYIQPYLDNFGVPYTVLDIASSSVGPNVGEYSVIIVGHRSIDPNKAYLDSTEEANITAAVNNGTGFVNFDNDLSTTGNLSRYQFVQNIFGFSYGAPSDESGVNFTAASNFIKSSHQVGELIDTYTMHMAGIIVPNNVTVLARSGNQPFLSVTTAGQGRAVQWGTYDWMAVSVKGPVYGLDDLVWRSIVWAARKPFVMKGLPNFLTMRVDDGLGPFWWIDIANEFGLKPWAGLFMSDISDQDATHLSSLVRGGQATASIHAFSDDTFFYYNYGSRRDWPDQTMSNYFSQGTQWHTSRNIPISKFVLPHFYEFGTNVFGGLSNWGVEFIGTVQDPGKPYPSPWIIGGPYRLYEPPQSSDSEDPFTYADFIKIPNHPEFNGRFFNCVTEIRDDAGYEWYPDNDVSGSIGRGTRQIKRAFDSMVLATLFTHEYYIESITQQNWRAILQGIITNLASYNPIFTTMDYACQYLRAMYTTDVTDSTHDTDLYLVRFTVVGQSDIATQFFLFTGEGDSISSVMIPVPSFSGSTAVTYQLPRPSEPPVAANDAYSVDEDNVLNVSPPGVLANDTDVDSPVLTAVLVTGPAHGTLTLNSSGSFTYTPAANFNGTDSFTYRANDGYSSSNNAIVTITVNPMNDPPVAANDAYSVLINNTLNVSAPGVLANDTDVDSSTLTAVLISGPAHGTLTLNANGSFIYTPSPNFNGTDTFTYRANDGISDGNVATVTIAVSPDLIFADGFESGSLSAWSSSSTGGGDLSVSSAVAFLELTVYRVS